MPETTPVSTLVRVIQGGIAMPLHGIDATRLLEHACTARLPPHTLMQRAGWSVARLALAIAPHARSVWVACGPGNNGGDGLEAAIHLQRWGKQVVLTWLGTAATAPADAAASCQRALDAGVRFADAPPEQFDVCIDALLGIGASSAAREPEGRMAQWIAAINAGTAPVLAVDMPTGLNADTGHAAALCVKAQFTLSLLTLKPGLFTAQGRDVCGEVWLDMLDRLDGATSGAPPAPAVSAPDAAAPTPTPAGADPPTAWLMGSPQVAARAHASHKGSYGDVAVIGGAAGMTGAALLAAAAALHFGAGRVFVGLLDGGQMLVDPHQPELMFRALDALDFKAMTVVCGCGGGAVVRHPLARVLSSIAPVVIDADAINSIANDTQLEALLCARAARHRQTVLTPHPLEAARLLGTTAAHVQQDRLAAARRLSDRLGCTVVLKGSGTVIAAPGQTLVINPTGNAALATAGTGDVLAGMIGARLANRQTSGRINGQINGVSAFQAACEAVYLHGKAADDWPAHRPLTAGSLVGALRYS